MEASEAFCEAILTRNETLVLQMLQSGVDPTYNNNLALLNAVGINNCGNIINLLLHYGARANASVLDYAVQNYNDSIVEKLLHHGADAKELINYNQNALHTACNVYGDKTSRMCEVLIKSGAEVNQQSQICRVTPLWNAIDKGNNKVIEILLQYGAKPCLELDAPMGRGVPLEYSFSLKATTIQSVIKYAALQVNSSDDREVHKFLQYIVNARNKDGHLVPNIGKKYAKFSRDSLGEVNILKEKFLNEDGISLFDFVVSQGDILESYKDDSKLINRVFDHVISTPFPVYGEVILKKLEKNMIIRKFVETPQCQLQYVFGGEKRFVNSDCIQLIATYLSVIDLGNLLISLTVVS